MLGPSSLNQSPSGVASPHVTGFTEFSAAMPMSTQDGGVGQKDQNLEKY